MAPQVAGSRLYFVSDLSGRLSLYVMNVGGSVPEPLLPPDIALQNPHHIEGAGLYQVLPRLGKLLLMLDHDGDENYQPTFIPLDGGLPEPIFGERFAGQQVICTRCLPEHDLALFTVDPRREPLHHSYLVNLATLDMVYLGSSAYGNFGMALKSDGGSTEVILADSYTFGDVVLYRWQREDAERRLLYGAPLTERKEGAAAPLTGFGSVEFSGDSLLLTTSLFEDTYGLGYLSPDHPDKTIHPVPIVNTSHSGAGELTGLRHLDGRRYALSYNIDGASWLYEGVFDETALRFVIERTICGAGLLSNGVLESYHHERESGRYALSFSTATSPSQLYLVEPNGELHPQTNERILAIPSIWLAAGEDASYTSHDGLRISARLYLPAPALGYTGKRPLVFYIHGGPQSQERPDFTWFSMPLIQFLTLNGFAVFVPNVRGSTGYGARYVKQVDHDWGGQDRFDHVHAVEVLRNDERLAMDRVGVMGRSYGGFMTLTLAGRHPQLWKAACDMFGPYDLFTFMERIPETWKTYFSIAVGNPETERDFLIERSPSTHLHNLACPLLVIQGANDPRVVERESRDLVETLRSQGKQVDYLVFEDEGHDVLKFKNKAQCYSRITDFFREHLM
jgi:pimeloyl-ACP methyl ester carboxylesterase